MIVKEELLQGTFKLGDDIKTYKATVDQEDIKHIMWVLSSSLYSDPLGSLVRELVSNGWDSHIEAKNTIDNIIIDFTDNILTIKDFGTGLSPEKINNVYRKFGKSTKRHSNEQIGSFGIGKYSVFAYTSMYFIETVVDNIYYKYILTKDSGVPEINLLEEKELSTPISNYTSVLIPIEPKHKDILSQKVLEQTFLFDKLSYGGYLSDLTATNIYGENFIFSKNVMFKNSYGYKNFICVAIGKVFYKIPAFDKLLSSTFFEPFIILKFNIGDLPVTPNRENIILNDSTKEIIKNKWKDAIIEIFNKFIKKEGIECASFEEYFCSLDNFYNSNIKFNILHLKIKVEKHIFNDLNLRFNEPKYKYELNSNFISGLSFLVEKYLTFYSYCYDEKVKKIKTQYPIIGIILKNKYIVNISQTQKLSKYERVKITEFSKNENQKEISLLKLNLPKTFKFKKSDYQTFKNCLIKNENKTNVKAFILDLIEIYNGYKTLASLPESTTSLGIKTKINSKKIPKESFRASFLVKNSNGKYVFKSNVLNEEIITSKEFRKKYKTIIYSSHDEKENLKELKEVLNSFKLKKNSYSFVSVNELTLKKLKDKKHFIHFKEIYENPPKCFKSAIIATKIFSLTEQNKFFKIIFKNKEFIKKISKFDYENILEIETIRNNLRTNILLNKFNIHNVYYDFKRYEKMVLKLETKYHKLNYFNIDYNYVIKEEILNFYLKTIIKIK